MRSHVADDGDLGGRRGPVLAGLVAGAALLLGAGVGLGRATAAGGAPAAAPVGSPPVPALAASAAGPARLEGDVPEGYAHSPAGALMAAESYLQVEGSSLVAHPDAYRAAVRAMCTPAYWEARARASAEEQIDVQEERGRLVSKAAAGEEVVERTLPLTASVTAYAPDRATVGVWSLGIVHAGDGPTNVVFVGGSLELAWSDSDWKLDGGTAATSVEGGSSAPVQLTAGPQLPPFVTWDGLGYVARP